MHACDAARFCTGLAIIAGGVDGSSDALDFVRNLYIQTVLKTLTGETLSTPTLHFDAMEIRPYSGTEAARSEGAGGCQHCLTMVGQDRLCDLLVLLQQSLEERVDGDFVETGAWRGGVAILAQAFYTMHELTKQVYVCDSFSGFPTSWAYSLRHPFTSSYFSVDVEEVRRNFEVFGLLNDRVHFIKGFFNDTMPLLSSSLVEAQRSISILHLDGDLYESYMDVLFNLYEAVQEGGYIVCDDCDHLSLADRAVQDFRALHGISSPLLLASHSNRTRYWRKTQAVQVRRSAYSCWNTSRLPWGVRTCEEYSDDRVALLESTFSGVLALVPAKYTDSFRTAFGTVMQEVYLPTGVGTVVEDLEQIVRDLLSIFLPELMHTHVDVERQISVRMVLEAANMWVEAAFRMSASIGHPSSELMRLYDEIYELRYSLHLLPEWVVQMV